MGTDQVDDPLARDTLADRRAPRIFIFQPGAILQQKENDLLLELTGLRGPASSTSRILYGQV